MTATAPHRLDVRVLSDEAELGMVAAADVAEELRARSPARSPCGWCSPQHRASGTCSNGFAQPKASTGRA